MNVRLPSDLQRLAPFLVVALLGIAGLLLVTRGLGNGNGGGGANAQQVLDRAFSGAGKGESRSGKMAIKASADLQGAARASGSFTVQADGRFDAPKLDLDMKVSGAGQDRGLGLLVDGKRGYVELDGRWYELPAETLNREVGGAQNLTAALGFDPRGWLRNPRSEGTEQVGGVATDHISADVDVTRMASDLTGLAARAGQTERLTPQVREGLDDAVEQARVDLYVGQKDGVLYKLAVSARLDGDLGGGAPPVKGDLKFDVAVTDVGKPQRIVAPRSAAPAGDLPGIAGQTGSAKAKTGSGSSGSGNTGSAKSGSAAKRSEQAYLGCVQQAQDSAALDKCQALLP
jgi:hypothetical protein